MTSEIVVDASALVSVLVDPTGSGRKVAAAAAGLELVAPTLLPYELVHALRRLEHDGTMSQQDSTAALARGFAAPVALVPPEALVVRMWELRRNLTAYDAAYVALAEQRSIPLMTLDQRLARAPGLRCTVIVPV